MVTKLTMGRTPKRRSLTTPGQSSHPTLISGPTTDLVCTCDKIPLRRDPGNRPNLSAVPKKHLSQEPASLTTTISNFQLILHGSQVFPNSIGRISFTRPCPWYREETVVREIMLFIGKPRGRSIMISNVVN